LASIVATVPKHMFLSDSAVSLLSGCASVTRFSRP
jgi:hypothetical protein